MNEQPIGIFDSGVGGLTVVEKIVKFLPKEKIIYFGDTARVPYGTKSYKIVKNFALDDVKFLLKFKPKLIVIACHTVSSLVADILKKKFPDIFFIDVVKPSIEKALKITENKKIGIIGTPATIRSGKYQKLLKEKKIKSFAKACPLFVPLVEEGWINHHLVIEVANIYLKEFKKEKIDTLILGCTHYPILKKIIQKVMGEKVKLVDASEEVALSVKKFLMGNNLFSNSKKTYIKLFFSDLNPYLEKIIKYFLKHKKVKIEEMKW